MVCVGVCVGGMAPTYIPVSIAEEESQALTGPAATPSPLQHFYSSLRRPGIKTVILSSVVLQNTCYALVRRYSRGALHEKASLARPPFFVDTCFCRHRVYKKHVFHFFCVCARLLLFFLCVCIHRILHSIPSLPVSTRGLVCFRPPRGVSRTQGGVTCAMRQ